MADEAGKNSEPFVIVVHAGAGDHPKKVEVRLLRTIKQALRAAHSAVSYGHNGQTVITTAMSVLEDSPLTNAGIGSSLNLDGEVECDASIVDGSDPNAFASVAALKKMKNPTKAAGKVLELKLKSDLPCGLVPPGILCSSGANSFCVEQGLAEAELSTTDTRSQWEKYRKRLVAPESMETVGAVCIVGSQGQAAIAAASSGGSWMKHPGRIGAAGTFGTACYASGRRGASVSGQGEALISGLAAYETVRSLARDDMESQTGLLAGRDAGFVSVDASSGPREAHVLYSAQTPTYPRMDNTSQRSPFFPPATGSMGAHEQ
uniref:Asparaginase n=1 Tax=Rhodosorus marinus TaxID=101924 RepID=A0A7S3ENY4_9RHOD|mmetsp:Transcript_9458/g.40932  ORF Transcript_9458/g.40932 Transcript_9458/m.40932 type:complete len:318 (+) Transcript_9458:717-1670(+)